MMNTLTLTKVIQKGTLRLIDDWQDFLRIAKNRSSLSPISQQISRLQKELDRSFPEFGDLQETVVTYNLYRRLETLQQQINNIEE